MEETTEEFDSPTPKELVYQDVLNLVSVSKGKAIIIINTITPLPSPQVVGDYGRWQLKVVVLLWIPMFFCGTQFVTTDFMNLEPKVLFCEHPDTCNSYDNIFPSNTRCVFKYLHLICP